MTQVTFAGGSIGQNTNSIDLDADTSGIVDGDPLIFNATTNRLEPYSQAGNTTQAAFLNLIGLVIGPPTSQLP